MSLTLNVTSSNNHAIEEQIAYDFSESGGTIGRRLSNTWVLPDENRHLSGSHARIEFEKGNYYIIDTSTNGVFINGNAKPLGSETRQVLEDGFQLIMGTYTIDVSVSNDSEATSGNTGNQDLNEEGLFADLVDEPNDNADSLPLKDILVKENTSPISVDAGSEDPFFEFGEFSSDDDVINKAPSEPPKRIENDQIPELDSFFQPAKVKHVNSVGSSSAKEKIEESVASGVFEEDSDVSLIPDDWNLSDNDDPFDDMLSGLGDSRKEDIPLKKEEITPAEEEAVSNDDDPFDELLAGTGDSFVITEVRPPPRKKSTPPKRKEVAPEEEKGTSKEEVAKIQQKESINSLKSSEFKPSTSLSPFFEGVGIDEKLLGSSFSEEHLFLAGKLFRSAIQGTMEVLQSRAEIKNEMRMDMTVIQPIRNNPIKFAAGADEALRKLFTLDNKSYMDSEEAMMEAYDDIKSHQVAVISGIQASLVYVLKRFEPENLIRRLEKESPISANIPIHRKAKLWDKFEELYETIESEAEDDFNRLFGQEFANAYEKQVTLLKKERE